MNSFNKLFSFESAYVGRVDYATAFEMQQRLWQMAKDKNQFSVVGLEHPAVITLGRRAQSTEVLNSVQSLPVVQSTRGGLATLHSEGQLVIYPIMNLRTLKVGVKDYVEKLLTTTQKTFSDFDVQTELDTERVGLYTSTGKIAFCGLEIRHGISLHGLSINLYNDLDMFDLIRSCGVQKMQVDSLQNYRADVSLAQFFRLWTENLNHLSF